MESRDGRGGIMIIAVIGDIMVGYVTIIIGDDVFVQILL
jgi:hypothetical protein